MALCSQGSQGVRLHKLFEVKAFSDKFYLQRNLKSAYQVCKLKVATLSMERGSREPSFQEESDVAMSQILYRPNYQIYCS